MMRDQRDDQSLYAEETDWVKVSVFRFVWSAFAEAVRTAEKRYNICLCNVFNDILNIFESILNTVERRTRNNSWFEF